MTIAKRDMPIFVTGIERSGNSFVARMISMCGAFSGRTTKMMENRKLRSLVSSYYNQLHIDSRGQYPLAPVNDLYKPTDWKHRVEDRLEMDRYAGDKLWLYKSSRIAQIWPIWNEAYPDAHWIIVRRATRDVLYSCMNTSFMNAYRYRNIQNKINVTNEREGWLWWVHQHEDLFRSIMAANLNYTVIWPERMLNGDYRQARELIESLGLKWNPKVVKYLDLMLYKN